MKVHYDPLLGKPALLPNHAETHAPSGSDPILSNGASNHAALDNLDYANANHTGFMASPQEYDYTALTLLATNNALEIGRQYILTDFHTQFKQYYYLPDYISPITEKLILTATSTSSFDSSVMSLDYPQDEILYEFVDTSPEGVELRNYQFNFEGFHTSKGRITYRRDTLREISAYEDWRHVKYYLYSSSINAINNIFYSSITHTGTGLSDMSVSSVAGTNSAHIFDSDSLLTVIIGASDTYSYTTVDTIDGNTGRYPFDAFSGSGTITTDPIIIGNGVQIVFGSSSGYTEGDIFTCTIYGNEFTGSEGVSITPPFSMFNESYPLFSIKIGKPRTDGYSKNVFFGGANSTTLAENALSNVFGNEFESNEFGTECRDNKFGYSCTVNSAGNNFQYSRIVGPFRRNKFGNNTGSDTKNIFGTEFKDNIIGNNCQNNVFGDNCQYNTFGRNFGGDGQNIIGNNFQFNIVENDISNQTIASDIQHTVAIGAGMVCTASNQIKIIYDPTTSGLTATDIKAAIDEVTAKLIPDAPSDGKIYIRRNGSWEELIIS